MFTIEDYCSPVIPSWCKGCAFHGVLASLTQVLFQKQIDPTGINIISGIGCSSRLPFFLNTFGMHTLHGRALPIAIGARLSRPEIPVFVVAGDGDLFSIGAGHFVHAARKNFNITVLCLDNRMFAMTKNQSSPTSALGHQGSLSPNGKTDLPINVIELAIGCHATFVARSFASAHEHLIDIISQAYDHQGFSFVHILAPCQTFDKTVSSISFENMIDINKELSHDPADRIEALRYSSTALEYDTESNEKIPIGVFLKNNEVVYEQTASAVEVFRSMKTISFNKLYNMF
jgi:2-oxoglutarate/2-oxoacid ferredoxin oxidoreductase subunit beta